MVGGFSAIVCPPPANTSPIFKFSKDQLPSRKRSVDNQTLLFAARGGKPFPPMRKLILTLVLTCVAWRAFCADAEYKQVLVTTGTNSVRVRLPLTDVTGKVRVK